MRPKFEELFAMTRDYCKEHGLDPAAVSVTFNADYVITGHVFAPPAGFPVEDRCCCGAEGCDGGLAVRLENMGADPAEVVEYRGTIGLGER